MANGTTCQNMNFVLVVLHCSRIERAPKQELIKNIPGYCDSGDRRLGDNSSQGQNPAEA